MNQDAKPPINPGKPHVTPAGWTSLRRFTDARIALGRAGHSQPTAPHLAFQLAHAQARDAVHLPFDAHGVAAGTQALGLDVVHLHSAAADRATYLQRPDLGRRLDEASRALLQRRQSGPVDLSFVVGDGLSALAIHQNAVPLIEATLQRLRGDKSPWTLGPVAIVEQARVAVGDEAGAGLQARCVVVLIGERPGLSSPDSMGLYLTWMPRVGLTDASRNCISNVRPAGLGFDAAAFKLSHLLNQARQRQLSGVDLKDETGRDAIQTVQEPRNFLLR